MRDILTKNKDIVIINSYRYGKKELPIMAFQTNLNGTFDPSLILNSGTLRWIIDGVEYFDNNPSVILTGNTVDVEVYKNDVPEGVECTLIRFSSDGVIGTINADYFTINGAIDLVGNTSLDSVIFSSFNNVANDIDLGEYNGTSIDFSNVKINSDFVVNFCPNLETITFKNDNTQTMSRVNVAYNTSLLSVDFSDFTINGQISGFGCANIEEVTFSTFNNVSSNFQFHQCPNLLSLDLSNVLINGILRVRQNTNMSSLIVKSGSILTSLDCHSTGLPTLDLSGVTINGNILLYNGVMTSLITPTYTTALDTFRVENNALNLTSVDLIFSSLNAFFSVNTPIKDLTVNTSGGTNASPTGGAANTDIQSLITIFNNAGLTFNYTIN